jgi:hypothetical protein
MNRGHAKKGGLIFFVGQLMKKIGWVGERGTIELLEISVFFMMELDRRPCRPYFCPPCDDVFDQPADKKCPHAEPILC